MQKEDAKKLLTYTIKSLNKSFHSLVNFALAVKMKHEDIYNLSMKFSPPKVNLRKAQIIDDYGDESYAQLLVNHKKPDDVKREEFDYYGWVYSFVEPEDLLFYLYAIVIEYSKDKEIDCIDSFMYSINRELPKLQEKLTNDDKVTLENAFKTIWNLSGDDYVGFSQCKNIQELIGISIEI